jgi:hypothetical protein
MLVRISVLSAPLTDEVAGAVLNDRVARAHAGRRRRPALRDPSMPAILAKCPKLRALFFFSFLIFF